MDWDRITKSTIRNRNWVIGVMLFIVLLAQLYVMTQIRVVTKSNADRGKTNQTILREIRSCTTPAGECTKRGAASQGKAVQIITDTSVAANYCALILPESVSYTKFIDCVTNQLKEKSHS